MLSVLKLALKKNYMNFTFSIILICLPLLLIYILGNALEGMQESGVLIIEKVGYYNALEGSEAESINSLIMNEAFDTIFEIDQLDSKAAGTKGMSEGRYKSIVFVEENDHKIHITLQTSNPNTPLASMLLTYTETSNMAYNAYLNGEDWAAHLSDSDVLIKKEKDKGSPMGIDYYAVLTLFQSLVIGGIFGIFSMIEDRDKNTDIRLKMSPIAKWKIIVARMIANSIYLFTLSVFVMIGSILLFNANWDGNMAIILVTMLLMAMIINGIGMLLGTLTKSSSLSIGILIVFLMLWSNTSGAYGPAASDSIFAVLSPNFNAKNIIFGTIYGGSYKMILTGFAWLLANLFAIYIPLVILEGRRSNEYI